MNKKTLLCLGAGVAALYLLWRKSGGLHGLGAANPCPKTMKYNKLTGQCACPGTKVQSPTTGLCITLKQYQKQFGTTPTTGQILCPASAAAETTAAAMCAAQGGTINVTNCTPFEYSCSSQSQLNQNVCGAGYSQQYAGGPCVYTGVNTGSMCAAGYSQQYAGGPCVYSGISTSYGSTMYPGAYSSAYMPQSQYSEPLIMPEEVGGGDGSQFDAAEAGDVASAEESIASSYAGPELTPTSEAQQQYNTDWYQTAPSSGGACAAGQGQATADQWGPLQVVQTVCASAQQSSGGYPSMTQVEQSDMTGLDGLLALGFSRAA